MPVGSRKKHKEHFDKQSYFRLLRYALPYKYRLAVGLISGFIVGGSLLGSMMMIPKLMKSVDQRKIETEQKHTEAARQVITIVRDKNFKSEEEQLEALKEVINPDKKKKEMAGEIQNIKETAAKFYVDLPIGYDNGNFTFETSWLKFKFPAEDANGNMTWQFFAIFVVGFVSLWTLKNIATYINRYFTRWVGTRVVADLRDEVFHKLMNQSMKFYGKMDVGQLIARCTNDTASIESAVANTIADATRCPLEILACVTAILIASQQNKSYALLIILFVGLPLCVLPIVIIGRRVRKIYRRAYSQIAEVVSRMHEVFTGIQIVKAYHTEQKETDRFQKVNKKYFNTLISALKTELMMKPLMETVAVTSTLIFLIYAFRQNVTLTELAQLLVPAFMAYEPVKKLAKVTNYLQRSMAAADRYFKLIDTDVMVKERENPTEINEFKNEIAFKNVDFSYEENKILEGLDVTIPKGNVMAVVGQTGSGKTTIANLIARFYDVDSGSVTIDGHDVRDLKVSSLRDLIGIVTQDTILFNESIADNISYGNENVTHDQIVEAAKKANAHQFISQEPDGYDKIVGEKGCNVSGGEKQRIAIARAILKNPPILILDEATSALDTVTERLVQEALDRVMENRTVFAIAHRLSTIKHADTIIVLEKGKIIEQGSHDELMSRGGSYKKLHDTQFGIH